MILVTVGTHHQGFERLVSAMDELAGDLDERVIIQYGASRHVPQHAEGYPFTTGEEMAQLTSQARVVVTHAAAGAVTLALKMAKPVVVVPRRMANQEHFDDHQQQLAKALAEAGKAVTVIEPTSDALRLAIEQAAQLKPRPASPDRLRRALLALLETWEGQV